MFLAEYDISEEVCKSEIQKAIDIFTVKVILAVNLVQGLV
jgi:hypothetical protein